MVSSVLVVDDNPAFARSLQILLEDERPCQVRIASSMAQAAAELGADETIDVIVSDIGMLAGEGMRLLGELRTRGNDVTIALMTAHPALLSRAECQALDIRDIFVKPIDPELFLNLLDR